jgi:HEAT repeat protein
MSSGNQNISIENLIESLQDADPLVRIHAAFALGSMEEDALPAVPVLIEMLKFGDEQDRKLAATTFGQLGPVASDAVPALLEAANDEEEGVADMALWALEEIDLADMDEEPGAEAA